ncbi:MAG: amidohydrolase, partial [Planctomycetota bacterium]|nr:amidohydrolase [Planctomycetota bacterium]
LQPLGDVEAALIFSARASDVVFTMVEGEVLFEGGRCLRLDEAALREEVAAVARRIPREEH